MWAVVSAEEGYKETVWCSKRQTEAVVLEVLSILHYSK